MQLLNHHQRPWHSCSDAYVMLIIASFVIKSIMAEYDCSAKADGWYYDPDFCHVYWRCTHGKAEEFECASGTAWDHHDDRCDWLDTVDCSRAEKTTPKMTSDEEGDDDDDDDDDADIKEPPPNRKLSEDTNPSCLTVSQATSSAESFCAGRDGFFADPKYCTRYYRCAHGVDQAFECPKGTAWDEGTKSCAWMNQVNCDQKKSDYSTSTTTEDTTTSRKRSDTQSQSNISPSHAKDISGLGAIECQLTGTYNIADPGECNAYYQCDKGIRTRLNCPERQLFDAEKRQCLEYEKVFCASRSVNLADKNQCISKRDGIHPDIERDCHFYYQCVTHIKMKEAKCPGDQKFNSYTSKCGPASSAPMPCGTYILGSATIPYQRNIGFLISFVLSIVFFIIVDL